MPAEAPTPRRLAERCDAFFDSELAAAGSHAQTVAPEPTGGDSMAGAEPRQLALASLFLAGESLAIDRECMAVLRVRSGYSRIHFLLPETIRSAARELTSGVRISDLPIGAWPEDGGASLSLLVYRIRRSRRTDRLLGRLRDLVAHADRLTGTAMAAGLVSAAIDLIELLRRPVDADLLLGGEIGIAPREERCIAVLPEPVAAGPLALHAGQLAAGGQAIGTHALLRIGPRPATTDVRRHIELLRRQALMRQQFAHAREGQSYLGYLQKEVKEQRRETIQALYGHASGLAPVVTPVALEAAANLATVVAFSEEEQTPFKSALQAMRERIHRDLGVRIPPVRIRLNEADLPAGTYLIMISEVPLVMGTVDTGKLYCGATVEDLQPLGIAAESAIRPNDGGAASWVGAADQPALEAAGHELLDAGDYLVFHLESVLCKHAVEFFGLDEVVAEFMVGGATSTPHELQRLRDAPGGIVRFRQTLTTLLDENLTCAPLLQLAQRYLERPRAEPVYETAEDLRMLPAINDFLLRDAGRWILHPLAEDCAAAVSGSIQRDGYDVYVAMAPELTQDFLAAVRATIDPPPPGRLPAIVVESWQIRRFVRRIVELEFPAVTVVARRELAGLDPRLPSAGPPISLA